MLSPSEFGSGPSLSVVDPWIIFGIYRSNSLKGGGGGAKKQTRRKDSAKPASFSFTEPGI